MKLSDIVGNAGLSGYAQIALVLFIIAFVLIVWWVFRPSARARWRAAKMIPLDDAGDKSRNDAARQKDETEHHERDG